MTRRNQNRRVAWPEGKPSEARSSVAMTNTDVFGNKQALKNRYMNRRNQNGFVLMFVITTLVLMGAMLAVLGSMSQKFVFETNRAYLEACSRNLSASGLAWAKHNLNNEIKKSPLSRIALDVNDMKMPNSTLSLEFAQPTGRKSCVAVHTFVSRGRQHIHKKSIFALP